MTEIQKLLSVIDKAEDSGQAGAIVTLVKVDGSSYRRPGARMVVYEDGTWAGAISGGCLEGDVLLRAQKIIAKGAAELVRYDTMNDDDNVFGVGLGCNGIIDLLIEPFHSLSDDCVTVLRALQSPEQIVAHGLVYRSTSLQYEVGRRWLIEESTSAHDENIPAAIVSDCLQHIEQEKSANRIYTDAGGEIEVLIEILRPQTRLVIFGAGNDVVPLSQLASTLGWHITVTDKSLTKATSTRFPLADEVYCASAKSALTNVLVDTNSVCIVMSHDLDYDAEILRQLAATDAAYIGLLGPRTRFEKIRARIGSNLNTASGLIPRTVHSPAGLDLGAETPEEIALSIVAEIQSVLHNGSHQKLSTKPGTIHERAVVNG